MLAVIPLGFGGCVGILGDVAESIEALADEWHTHRMTWEGLDKIEAGKSVRAVKLLALELGWRGPHDVQRPGVLDWLMKYIASGHSRVTAKKVQSRVKLFGDWLVTRNLLDINPLASIRMPRVKKCERGPGARAFTVDEVRRLILAAEHMEATRGQAGKFGPNRSVLYCFFALTGLRYSEAMRLTWADLDEPGRALTITRDKAGRGDVVPVHLEAMEAMRQLRAFTKGGRGDRIFRMVSHHTLTADMKRAGVPRRCSRCNRTATPSEPCSRWPASRTWTTAGGSSRSTHAGSFWRPSWTG